MKSERAGHPLTLMLAQVRPPKHATCSMLQCQTSDGLAGEESWQSSAH
jgi:hypothetical protein